MQPPDSLADNRGEVEMESTGIVISPVESRANRPQNTGNADMYYLDEIARTPLLTPQEEAECFQQFTVRRQRISALLDRLPPLILENVKMQVNLKPESAPDDNGEAWWSPMDLGVILERVQKEIQTYQHGQTCSQECLQINQLWSALSEAAQQMQDTKSRLIEANLLLVANISRKHYSPRLPLSFLDLMQEGSMGLMKAVDKFDPRKGFRFSTYATWWIMQSIRRALDQQSRTVRLPCYLRDIWLSIKKASTKLTKELGREPDIQEIAEAVELPETRVLEVLQTAKQPISLSSPLDDSPSSKTISDFLVDESQLTPDEELVAQSGKDTLEKVLGTLNTREAFVIEHRYGLDDGIERTLAEIAQELGLSRERVRQIEKDALRKLRHPTRRQYLEELL
jgi:RNA polymerase primary sigma factor